MAGHPEDRKINILTGVYSLFDPGEGTVELDLGCGSGTYTAALAILFPERKILGADVMIGRLRKLVSKITEAELQNVEVLRVEARNLVGRMLPDRSIDRIHLLCPDPWPKERHRGHRLLCCDFTTQLHRVLKKDGVFHFSSDDVNYCNAVGRIVEASGLFAPDDSALDDIRELRSDFERRWQEKGLAVNHRAWRKLPLPKITIGH